MWNISVKPRRRRAKARFGFGAIGALLSAALTACGTTTPVSASPSTPAGAPANGSHTLIVFYRTTPHAVLAAVPAGAKLTALDTASSSRDGLTLYLGFEAANGKCGTYDVVLVPSSRDLAAGVIHSLPSGKACPTQETSVLIVIKLTSSLGDRPVLDLATGSLVVATAA